ncbi:MAG: LysR family transcriptional regulator [Clostridia bacterium]|nr:LysR family transcriptional regulator [Clostridia bacterium]
MNIFHMKYAVEVARLGSINKASETLGMAQPNISRAIKELESDLGITIFDRSAKGMMLTPEGKEFITRAKNILGQLDNLESMFREGIPSKQRFSVSAPRAAYIVEAFASFTHGIDGDSAEIVFDETATYNTIKKVIASDCKLGIIRYEEAAEEYFKKMLDSNELVYSDIVDFDYVIITNRIGELAKKGEIYDDDLRAFTQITHNNPYQATLSASDTNKVEQRVSSDRRIYVLDTAAQLEILTNNPDTFMWISPAPDSLLDRYGLTQLECIDKKRRYKDVLIHRKAHKLTELDKAFIDELLKAAEFYKNY